MRRLYSKGYPYPPGAIVYTDMPQTYQDELLRTAITSAGFINETVAPRRDTVDCGPCVFFGGYLIQTFEVNTPDGVRLKLVGKKPVHHPHPPHHHHCHPHHHHDHHEHHGHTHGWHGGHYHHHGNHHPHPHEDCDYGGFYHHHQNPVTPIPLCAAPHFMKPHGKPHGLPPDMLECEVRPGRPVRPCPPAPVLPTPTIPTPCPIPNVQLGEHTMCVEMGCTSTKHNCK